MKTCNITVYTDGSCHTQLRVGAWASILFIDGEKIVLTGEETDTTHNRMELLAVIKAIEFLDESKHVASINIFADSQYVCDITSRKEKLKAKHLLTNKGTPIQNADLVQTLIHQIETHNLQFIKVKAHEKTDTTASKYNAEVDKLSREMVRKRVINRA